MSDKNGFRLTQGDVEILTFVYQLRLVTVDHLIVLTGRTLSRLNKRLVKLSRRGYLYRRRDSLHDKYVYTIHRASVPVLVEQGIAPAETIDLQARRLREIKSLFLKHALMLTDIHVCLELASRESPIKLVGWREGKELYDSVEFFEGGEKQKLPVRPDAFFSLQDTRRPKGRNRADFFLEADRSTTTHKRFQRKMKGYWHYLDKGLHKEKYGIKGAPVVTITRTEARALNLCAASREVLPTNARFYYFAPMEYFSVEEPERVFADIFMSPQSLKIAQGEVEDTGKRYYLIPPPLAKSG